MFEGLTWAVTNVIFGGEIDDVLRVTIPRTLCMDTDNQERTVDNITFGKMS